MEISVGAKLLFELGGMEERRLGGVLVGWKTNNVLLASVPLFAGIRDYLQVGRHATCRYMYEGIVYGFRSKILGYITSPDSLLFLSYPEQWESLELRKQQRVPCFFPARFLIDGQVLEGILNDITVAGCRIECGPGKEVILEQLRLGMEVSVTFFPFGNDVSYHVDAILANAATDAKGVTSIGFRLVQPDAGLLALIEQHADNVDRYSL